MVLDFLLPKKERRKEGKKEKVFKPAEKLRVQNYHTTPMAGNLSGEIFRLSRQAPLLLISAKPGPAEP